MLKLVKGDIFTTKCNIIAHGVNCRGVFNAGLAQQIRKKYPQAFDAYVAKYCREGWKCGDVQIVKIHSEFNKFIANLATQYDYGRRNVYASCDYIEECIRELSVYAEEKKLSIAVPIIGSGLGGLDKKNVLEVFEKVWGKSLSKVEVWSLE